MAPPQALTELFELLQCYNVGSLSIICVSVCLIHGKLACRWRLCTCRAFQMSRLILVHSKQHQLKLSPIVIPCASCHQLHSWTHLKPFKSDSTNCLKAAIKSHLSISPLPRGDARAPDARASSESRASRNCQVLVHFEFLHELLHLP